jgi:hypothetical protein
VATISVQVGGTVNDAVLRIAIITPTSSFFNTPQYVDLRINGLGATVCPEEVDVIRVDKPVTHNVLKSSCEFRAHDPSQTGPKFAGLPRLIVERNSTFPKNGIVNNIITTFIPRQDTSQFIQARWGFGNAPGMVFMPTSPSAPVITAATFSDSRSTATTIDPADFASFQEVVQRSILPIFTGHGLWGLVWLGLFLALLLVIKDVVVAILKGVWGLVRRFGSWLIRKLWNRLLKKPWNRIRSRFKRQGREAGVRQDGETDSVVAGQPEDSSPHDGFQ